VSLSEFHLSTIVKTNADFSFTGFACRPEHITDRIGVEPDEVRVKGDKWLSRDGRERVVPTSGWFISSTSQSKDINEHLRELLARLQSANLPFDPAWGEAAFGVLWKSNYLYAGNGPYYAPDVLAGIGSVGAALYHDIYQVDEEPPDETSELQRVPRRYFVGE